MPSRAPGQPPDADLPARLPDGRWTAPFVMAPFNTRIVRRSNALQDWAYGRGLRYGEVMGAGRGPAGGVTAAGMAAGLPGPGRDELPAPAALLDRVLPAPGSGPGEEARRKGWFRWCSTPPPGRPAVPGHCRRPGRPRVRRDRRHAGGERPRPGAGRRAASGPRRLADPGHGSWARSSSSGCGPRGTPTRSARHRPSAGASGARPQALPEKRVVQRAVRTPGKHGLWRRQLPTRSILRGLPCSG